MAYQIDPSRLSVLFVLLGAGMFIATRLSRPTLPTNVRAARSRRRALRGMWLMTLLGLASGLAGGLAENVVGESALVQILHAVYSVCWAPAFGAAYFQQALFQQALAAPTASGRFAADVLGLLGLLLIPSLWFVVFLCVGQLATRRG